MPYIVTSTVIQAGEIIHNLHSECEHPRELAAEILRHLVVQDDERVESIAAIWVEGAK